MHQPRRRLGAVGVLSLLVTILPFGAATPVLADSPASVPDGFKDEAMLTVPDHPMAVAFVPNGNVFVAEKSGIIRLFTSLSDATPSVYADLRSQVHNYWDRGMMGMAIDPAYTTGRPYVYVLYAYNHIPGHPDNEVSWPDSCPRPPGGTTDGCVISGRLSKLTSSGGVVTEQVLIEDWCQQFPSHSVGSLQFGPDGALYASAGEGASFNGPDYGQLGGTNPDTVNPVTPRNPCGDPGGSNPSPPTAEGGALRSQDMRTLPASGDPVGLDGAVIRIDPDSGAAWPDNATFGMSDANASRIIAYGLRNPYRFTIKPSGEVWIGDVGFNTWEELDKLPDPNAAPKNFGWPCYEGDAVLPAYNGLGLSICNNLAQSDVTMPYYEYNHASSVASGDQCTTGRGSSVSGLAFLSSTSGYPDSYDGALFMADYSRRCIWVLPSAGGQPGAPELFANLDRGDPNLNGGAVFLTTGPNGDLVYADYDRNEIRRIHYYGPNVPPVANFTATPAAGAAPLTVAFDASGSSDANNDALTYAWDLDGNGAYDDATGVTASKTYTAVGDVKVGLKVTDTSGRTSTASQTISVGNSPPTVDIEAPLGSLTWKVGDAIPFSGSATDAQDGTLPASAFVWTLTMLHCPSDCHSHIIQSYPGVKSGTIDGPDHEYPSHLLLAVTVTDSGGLKATAQVELFPKTGTVAANTSPAGIPITVGPATGAPPPAVTGIQGSTVSVSAPTSVLIGEGTWSFNQWSDGGARTHGAPIGSTPTTVTAAYTLTGNRDRSDTCAGSPAPVIPSGTWLSGKFGSANDVDWYRFKLTATTRVRLVLGDLATAARMTLYSGCSKVLEVSDRAALSPELIVRLLPAGFYAVRLTGSGGTSTPDYSFLMKRMPNSVHFASARTRIDGNSLRFVGEIYNNTPHWVGPATVTARLYDAKGTLLATRSARTMLAYIAPRGRTPFSIDGPLPAGYDHRTLTVSARSTSRLLGTPSAAVQASSANVGGNWVMSGTVRNRYSRSVTGVAMALTLYDARYGVLDVRRATVGTSTLRAGASTTFSGTFLPTGLVPFITYARGLVYR